MTKIKEVIVVEGRDDQAALARAVDAASIATHGFGIRKETLELIEKAYQKQGIIIFTDPDFSGEQIRKRLTKLFPDAKQAYLTQDEAEKAGDIGIENASPQAILRALDAAKAMKSEPENVFDAALLDALGLTGKPDSFAKREALGKLLGIGTCNGSQFIKRLNRFGITEEELIKACGQIKA